MEKLTVHEVMYYFDGWAAHELFWPSLLANIFLHDTGRIYRPRTSMEEFFNDRPWLEKDPSLYDEYIKEDFRLKNEEIRRKKQQHSEIPPKERRWLVYLKKIS